MSQKEKEHEQSLYSNIWDEDTTKDQNLKSKLDFYEYQPPVDLDSQTPASALDITKNTTEPQKENLRDKTEKLFQIANNVKSPRFVDWKNSHLHLQLTEGKPSEFDNTGDTKFYKESDIGKLIISS